MVKLQFSQWLTLYSSYVVVVVKGDAALHSLEFWGHIFGETGLCSLFSPLSLLEVRRCSCSMLGQPNAGTQLLQLSVSWSMTKTD